MKKTFYTLMITAATMIGISSYASPLTPQIKTAICRDVARLPFHMAYGGECSPNSTANSSTKFATNMGFLIKPGTKGIILCQSLTYLGMPISTATGLGCITLGKACELTGDCNSENIIPGIE